MKAFTFNILGRKYPVESHLESKETEKINEIIMQNVAKLEIQYPNADKIDILVFYLIELCEKLVNLEKILQQKKETQSVLSHKIKKIQQQVNKEIEKLTNMD